MKLIVTEPVGACRVDAARSRLTDIEGISVSAP